MVLASRRAGIVAPLGVGLVRWQTRRQRYGTIVQVSTVVVGLDTTSRIIGVGVESIQMGADSLWWGKVLCCASSSLEDLVCERLGLAFGLVGGRDVLHGG